MENELVNNSENVEIICTSCQGTWELLDVKDDRPRVFKIKFFKKQILRCNLSGITSKIK